MATFIFPYKTGSKSVAALREKAGFKAIKLEGSKFKGSEDKIVLNWGCSTMSAEAMKSTIINHPEAVAFASNKLSFFQKVAPLVDVPEFTTNKAVAQGWVEGGTKLVVREKLSGHSGEGIVILDTLDDFDLYDHTQAKLYVKYIPKESEFRVHVMGGKVIDVQRKAKSSEYASEHVNWQIRSHANGFVFIREGVELPAGAGEQCIKAVQACGLDFGAVDVIYNKFRNKSYILEVNTAPGLEGSSVDNYIQGLTELFETRKGYRGKKNKALSFDEVAELLAVNPTPQTQPFQHTAFTWTNTPDDVVEDADNSWLGEADEESEDF